MKKIMKKLSRLLVLSCLAILIGSCYNDNNNNDEVFLEQIKGKSFEHHGTNMGSFSDDSKTMTYIADSYIFEKAQSETKARYKSILTGGCVVEINSNNIEITFESDSSSIIYTLK